MFDISNDNQKGKQSKEIIKPGGKSIEKSHNSHLEGN